MYRGFLFLHLYQHVLSFVFLITVILPRGKGRYIFNFDKYCQIALEEGHTNKNSHQQFMKVGILLHRLFPYTHKNCDLSNYFILANLMGERNATSHIVAFVLWVKLSILQIYSHLFIFILFIHLFICSSGDWMQGICIVGKSKLHPWLQPFVYLFD